MRLFVLVFLIVSTLALTNGARASGEDHDSKGMRPNFKLPSLFNFAQFKASFHKHYGSFMEELVRQKIFLGRAVQAFVSVVKYSHRKVSSYLAVNQRSDRTPSELKRNYVPMKRLYKKQRADTEMRMEKSDDPLEEAEETPVANLDDITSQLSFVEQHRQQPGYREIAQELQRWEEEAQFAPLGGGHQMREDNLRAPSNNPSYLSHVPLIAQHKEEEKVEPSLPNKLVSVLSRLPGASYVSNTLSQTASKVAAELSMKTDDGGDEVWLDLRDSNCLGPVKDQGDCGSCYAFTATALYEYLYCQATGKQVSFSEQYIVSCGPQLKAMLDACEGGAFNVTADFVDTYGLELAADFPYVEQNGTCPFDLDETHPIQMGYIRPLTTGFSEILVDDFELYLSSPVVRAKGKLAPGGRPIMLGFSVPQDFSFYGGGVDEIGECVEEDCHGMLLVGHGRQDGKEYWLFRNSYGLDWGEQGYYKVGKEDVKRCMLDVDYGIVSTAKFGKRERDHMNAASTLGGVKRRLEEMDEQKAKRSRLSQL